MGQRQQPAGFGALALAILFGLASTMLLRGSRVARIVLAGLAVIGFVGAIVYIFVGPSSAILPSSGLPCWPLSSWC